LNSEAIIFTSLTYLFGSLRPYQNGLSKIISVAICPPSPSTLIMAILNSVSNAFYDAGIFTWDFFLTLGNLVRFSRPVGKVTPEGHPGYGGYWPEFRPPQEGDSRSCCPGLNAMANHGMVHFAKTDLLFGSSLFFSFFARLNTFRNHPTQWKRHQVQRRSRTYSCDVQF